MYNPIKFALFLISLVQALAQQCSVLQLAYPQTTNAEYNQLNIANGEIYRLTYNDYFIGKALQYTQRVINGTASILQNSQYQGTYNLQNLVIAVTSSDFNGNPNMQSQIYFALAQLNETSYSILYSQIYPPAYSVIIFNTSYASFQVTAQSCLAINVIQDQVVITCLSTSLLYQFISSDYSQKYMDAVTVNSALLQVGVVGTAYVKTQAVGNFLVSLINIGSVNSNGTFVSTSSQLVINIYSNVNQIALQTITQTFTTIKGDFVTGFSITEQGILFVTTYMTGVSVYDCSNSGTANQCTQQQISIPNPFPIGTLGISVYNVDYSQNNFYVALISSTGIVTSIFNLNVYSTSLQTQQLIKTSQITQSNMFSTQVYINLRYVVVVNALGINVYPSRFNDINNGELLFSFTQSNIASAYDLFNNILVSINEANNIQSSSTYQFNNPILYISIPTQNAILSVTAIALGSNSSCLINFTLVTQTNPTTSNQWMVYNTTTQIQQSDIYNQLGPEFKLVFGSQQLINLNQFLIGPAIQVNSPYVQPSISKDISTSYQQVLEAPVIRSQYRINANQFSEKIIFAQNFYDPSYITVQQGSNNFEDSFLQLIEVDGTVVLQQCQALEDVDCEQLYYIKINDDILIREFALGFQYGYITFGYRYLIPSLQSTSMISFVTITYNIESGRYTEANTKTFTPESIIDFTLGEVLQISIAQNNFYMLYTDSNGIPYLSSILISNLYSNPKLLPMLQGVQNINAFYINVAAYGNLIFADTGSTVQGQLTVLNMNGGNAAIVGQLTTASGTNLQLLYALTAEGVYVINTNPNDLSINFYPRVELLPALYNSNHMQQLIVIPIKLPVYGVSQIQRVQASSRFLYVMVQQYQEESSSTIFVYRNSQTIINSLYYIISASYEFIANAQFSVVSALQYDAILYKASGGYRNSHILPEYEIVVKCYLNSNAQYQIEYNYLQIQVGTLLEKNQLQPEWSSFQILNLVSFVSELATIVPQNLVMDTTRILNIDPRQLYSGNIGNYILGTVANQNAYYFNLQPTVYSPPQSMVYQNPTTAVSTTMTLKAASQPKSTDDLTVTPDSLQDQYFYTFVQTDHVVLITPFVYFTPSDSSFTDNSTVYIDYPLSYKLPVLDPQPNSQICPLIFVDQFSQGVVSVCGTTVEGTFLTSFTIFNTETQLVQETQIIDIQSQFNFDSAFDLTQAKYILIAGTYLDVGIVVLTFRYVQNIGPIPPTDIIISFAYTAYLNNPTVTGPSSNKHYQLIQPLNLIWYVPNQDITVSVSISAFTLTPSSTTTVMFGLLCVSSSNEECLAGTIEDSAQRYSGVVLTVNFNQTSLQSFYSGNGITLDSITATTVTTNVIESITNSPFDVSIINIISGQNVNSISSIIQANSPVLSGSTFTSVPMLVMSQGNAYIVNMGFQLSDGNFIELQYSCTLMGLTNQNTILSASASGGQIVIVVSNPSPSNSNQVTLLNYGYYSNYCSNPNQEQLIPTNTPNHIVTAIGAFSYSSSESVPIVTLMSSGNNIPRTLISNQQYIQLLNTNFELLISAYPNYNVKGGVTLNLDFQNQTSLQQQISATPINTYVNKNLIGGQGGSITLTFTPTTESSSPKWTRKLWDQFIWGTILFAIIVGVLGFLFYKSQPSQYDYR